MKMESRSFANSTSSAGSGKDSSGMSLFHAGGPGGPGAAAAAAAAAAGAVYLPLPFMYGQMNSCPLVPNHLLPFPTSMLSQHGFSHQMASMLQNSSAGNLLLQPRPDGKIDAKDQNALLSSYGALLQEKTRLLEKGLFQEQQHQHGKGGGMSYDQHGHPNNQALQHHYQGLTNNLTRPGGLFSPFSTRTDEMSPFRESSAGSMEDLRHSSDMTTPGGGGAMSRATTLSLGSSEPSCSPSSTDDKHQDKMDSHSMIDDDVTKRETPWNVRDHFPSRCPICGVHVSPADLAPHFRMEIENLTEFHKNREWLNLVDLHSPDLSSPKAAFQDAFRLSSRMSERKPPLSRWEMFLRVRLNRQNRLSAARGRTRRRSGEMEAGEVSRCYLPQDQEKLHQMEALAKHRAEQLLSHDGHSGLSDEQAASRSIMSMSAIASPTSETSPTHWGSSETPSRGDAGPEGDSNYANSGGASEVTTTSADDLTIETKPIPEDDDKIGHGGEAETSSGAEVGDGEVVGDSTDGEERHLQNPEQLIEFLRKRLRSLEAAGKHSLQCPSCRTGYKKPVVSIGCWHVFCEKCWLDVLATKRLCPRCGVITSPSDLRRIHL